MKIFESVADAKAAKNKSGQKIETKGYYSPGDGGAATYLVKTAAEYGGTPDGYGDHYDAAGNVLVLQHNGIVHAEQFGAKGDWDGTTGTNNTAAFQAVVADSRVSKVIGGGSDTAYYFGTIQGDTALLEVTRQLCFDFAGASIVVDGDNSSAFTGTTFIKFLDAAGSVKNYTFEDRNFTFSGPSRGVVPVLIHNSAKSTRGYEIGPCHVKKGQSIVTAFSTDPNNTRASDIRLVGPVSADESYYGVNLANNGDNFSGHYTIGTFNRALFVYGVKDVDVHFYADNGSAASANLLISNSGAGFPATENITVYAHYKTLNGFIDIVEQPSSGSGTFKNISITAIIDAIGTNMTTSSAPVKIGAFDANGGFLTSGTLTAENIYIDIRTPVQFDFIVDVSTSSPNYGLLHVGSNLKITGNVQDFHVAAAPNSIRRHKIGDLNAITLEIDPKYLNYVTSDPALVRWKCDVTASQDTQFSTAQAVISSFDIIGYFSGGNLTLSAANEITKTTFGSSAPTVSLSNSGDKLVVSVSGYASNSGGHIAATLTDLRL